MKKSFLSTLLLAMVGMAGSLTAAAQTPEPSGQWKFNDTSDLMAATVGNVTLTPAVLGTSSISAATVSEAGITVAEGPDGGSAILVPATSGLKVTRADGAAASSNFSFMLDLKVSNAYGYDGLFQTNGSNSNDGDLFISKGQIGLGGYLGGYYGCIWNDAWYRIIMTNSNGSVKVYVNGEKVLDYATTEGRFEIDPVFYLLADEDGEKQDTYVSEVAFWETPLTDEQAAALGSLDGSPWITDASTIKEGDQFFIISARAKFNGSSTAEPKAMAPIQSGFSVNWDSGDTHYVYWGDLDKEADGFVWTAEKTGDQWAFLNKENGKYLGNMNTGESDVIFSDTPVGYTLTDLADGAGKFYMTNDESEHSLHVQGYLRNDRGNNSLSKQIVGDDDYEDADVARHCYPGRWRFLKLNADTPEPIDTRTQIGTAEEFEAFAQAVADGQTDIDAVLTADIELTGNVMVGNKDNQYAGTFDGDGHTVTYNYDITSNYCGLFSFVNGATIRNLKVEGTVTSTAIHFGALIGQANGTVLVENVVTDVDITGNRSGVTGDGGMLGANYANITFNNCATWGKMGHEGSSMYSSFSAWSNGSSSTTLNNCYSICELKEGTGTGNCFTLTHASGANILNNCYYLNAIGKVIDGDQTQITAEQVASGELCYKLNGDQSTIAWYQTLGTDSYPVPFATSEQVYANGELRCDGTSVGGGALTYSNSATSVVPPHTYEGGWCAVCGAWDAGYLFADSDGYYNIGTASDLAWYAELLAKGNPCANVKLTADIDLSTSNWPDLMIASNGNPFTGIFDGQEHTITVNYTNVTSTHQGLFRTVNGGTIRNLKVEGSVVSKAIHFGALMGRAEGTVLVENVVTDVNITGQMSQVTGDAGMVGANYAQLTFNNCATLGEMGYSGSSMYSSYCGWSDGSSSTTLNNCFTTCKLTEGTGTGSCFTLAYNQGTININNSYYLNEVGTVQGTPITEDMASGEFCYKLNGDQSTIGWYQTLGTDALPVPFASHAQVYANGTVRCDGAELPDSPIVYSNTEGQTVKPDHQYGADGICTVCGSPTQNADGFYLIDTAAKLNWFATKVASGTADIDALLAADIDLSTSDYPDLMIGTETAEYAGIFDGDGHTITYNYALVADKWRGLFAFVRGATIRNLYVEGSALVTNIHFGALIGRAYGTVLVENVITNVDITGQRSGVTGIGGMLGANYADITFTGCATLGAMGYEGSSMYSSFSAWSNGSSSTTLNNCYSLCKLTEGTGTGNCFTLTHKSGTVVINNSYYLNLIGTYVGGTQITEEEVASGALCHKLGNGWYQTLGTDAYPVFSETSLPVSYIGEVGWATMYDTTTGYALGGDVKAYAATFDGQYLQLAEVPNVPASTPVVLKGGYYNKQAQDLPAINVANELKGTDVDTDADGTMYVLAKPEGEEVGFFKATGTIAAGKAYYQSASDVKAFYFGDGGATGIKMVNGQSSMVNDEAIYNLAGQRVQKMQKGINIVNGRKILK